MGISEISSDEVSDQFKLQTSNLYIWTKQTTESCRLNVYVYISTCVKNPIYTLRWSSFQAWTRSLLTHYARTNTALHFHVTHWLFLITSSKHKPMTGQASQLTLLILSMASRTSVGLRSKNLSAFSSRNFSYGPVAPEETKSSRKANIVQLSKSISCWYSLARPAWARQTSAIKMTCNWVYKSRQNLYGQDHDQNHIRSRPSQQQAIHGFCQSI